MLLFLNRSFTGVVFLWHNAFMITIEDALANNMEAFKAVSDTAHLDAELLIAHVTGLSRAALFTHPEQALTEQQENHLKQLAERRLQNEPIAYITGYKEFWDLNLKVTPDVLIPRPETECLIEWILEHYTNDQKLKVADLGVGSGAIALSLAKERPNWIIHATDYSRNALHIAKENAQKYRLANVYFFHGAWCNALPSNNYDIIVSNPPYIDSNDKHLKHLAFEPVDALDGGKHGLDAIKLIIDQAKNYLKKTGLLIFEHGYDQHEAIASFLKEAGYNSIEDHNDLANIPRYYTARY